MDPNSPNQNQDQIHRQTNMQKPTDNKNCSDLGPKTPDFQTTSAETQTKPLKINSGLTI